MRFRQEDADGDETLCVTVVAAVRPEDAGTKVIVDDVVICVLMTVVEGFSGCETVIVDAAVK